MCCSLVQSQHLDVSNSCGRSLEDSVKALQNCSSELTPHEAANVLHRVTDLGFWTVVAG